MLNEKSLMVVYITMAIYVVESNIVKYGRALVASF